MSRLVKALETLPEANQNFLNNKQRPDLVPCYTGLDFKLTKTSSPQALVRRRALFA
jgi:hypothetical protein